MSITKKLFNVTVGDVITMAISAVAVAWMVGDFNVAAAIGIIIGNRIFALLENR